MLEIGKEFTFEPGETRRTLFHTGMPFAPKKAHIEMSMRYNGHDKAETFRFLAKDEEFLD
jgi:hypothetical protein